MFIMFLSLLIKACSKILPIDIEASKITPSGQRTLPFPHEEEESISLAAVLPSYTLISTVVIMNRFLLAQVTTSPTLCPKLLHQREFAFAPEVRSVTRNLFCGVSRAESETVPRVPSPGNLILASQTWPIIEFLSARCIS